jgi:hypothetical protein
MYVYNFFAISVNSGERVVLLYNDEMDSYESNLDEGEEGGALGMRLS